MPGWMGMRGLVTRSVHDMERERADTRITSHSDELQRRANEKIQEILRDQQGDMSAYMGDGEEPLGEINTDDVCSLPIAKIMSTKVAVLSYDDTLLTVQGIFTAVKFRHLPIVDDNGCIIGIVSDRDILRMTSPFFGTVNEQNRDKEIMIRKVGVSMTRSPVCARMTTSILGAVKLMNAKKISCLPVVEDENKKLLGIVTWKDIVRAFCPAGFDRPSDSQRLKTGVKVRTDGGGADPVDSNTTRVIVKQPEAAGAAATPEAAPAPRPRLSYEEEVNLASKRLAARVRAAREAAANGDGDGDDGEKPLLVSNLLTPPPPPARLRGGSDTKIIPGPDAAPAAAPDEQPRPPQPSERISQTQRLPRKD